MYYSLSTIKKIITAHQNLDFDYPYEDIYLIRLLQTTVNELVNKLQNEFNHYQLNDIQLLMLLAIQSKSQEGIMPSELSNMFKISRVQITRQLDILEKNEWIERRTHPTDRRSQHIFLTPTGTKFMQKVSSPLQQHLVNVLSPITKEEKNLLVSVLTKLLNHVTVSK